MNKKSLSAKVSYSLRLSHLRLAMALSIFTLVVISSLALSVESWADEAAPTSGTCNNAGTCLWSLSSDGTMSISAAINPETGKAYENVVMNDYYCNDNTKIGNRPWEGYLQQIRNVVVGDNITNIGSESFQNASNLKTVSGMKDVTNIGHDTFAGASRLSSISMPNVKTIGSYAFATTSLSSVDIPKVQSIGNSAFTNSNLLEYVGLRIDKNGNPLNVTLGDTVFKDTKVSNCSVTNRTACGSCGIKYIKSGLGCVKDCGAGYLGKEERCIDASLGCGENYKQVENWCNRIRYTPAEAAKVLNDDNNSVTITFKK